MSKGFKLNAEDVGFKTITPGEYEVYPNAVSKETASTGNKMAQFNYIVRDDVDQDCKGQEIRFDNFVETPNALWRVNQASQAAGLDMDKDYDGVWEWADDFINKAVIVVVDNREYNGKTFPEVKSFKPSQYGGIRKPDAPKEPGVDTVDIEGDDLPF